MNNKNILKFTHPGVQFVRDGLNVEAITSKFYRKVFVLCNFNPKKIITLYLFIYCIAQAALFSGELYFYGENSVNVFDIALGSVLLYECINSVNVLANFLLKEALSKKGEPKIILSSDK